MKRIVPALLLLSLSGKELVAQTPFYHGKTVRLVVGSSVGGAQDIWGRFVAQYLGKHIPASPSLTVENMPGAGTMIAANFIYNVARPDGLTIGLIGPALYVEQLTGQKEVRFDWAKFSWIGSPEPINQVLFIRSDSPYKTVEDILKAKEAPRCAATGRAAPGYFFPRLLEEALGLKFNMVVGYGGGGDMDLAIEKGEVHCRAGTVSAFLVREPTRTWVKRGFVHPLVQSGIARDPTLPDVPTIYELMERYKTPEPTRRLAKAMLVSGDFGRPFIGPPGIASDRLKTLREAFMKTMKDPEFLADAKKRGWAVNPSSGETLEAMAREIVVQPPEVIERMKKLLGT